MLGEPFGLPRRSIFMLRRAKGCREVSGNRAVLGKRHMGSCTLALLRLKGVPLQVAIQHLPFTVEIRHSVFGGQHPRVPLF